MISKNKIKLIVSLRDKKDRESEGLYIIEGEKIVREYLASGYAIKFLCATPAYLDTLDDRLLRRANEVIEVSEAELKRISSLKTPGSALAVAVIPDMEFSPRLVLGELSAALDAIRDPGNLGTIIRAAAWFGIRNIICSEDCADAFNPKTVQASMGALLHVNIFYLPLNNFLKLAKDDNIAVFGAVMDGVSVYDHSLAEKGIILIGNESKGISADLLPQITHRITIPRAGKSAPGSESLNAGMAASVIFSEFLRKSGRH